ncbi:IS5 family transposase [Thalassomonas haliotis]|uniref:IS5 family transposase n=1 Tax=Thalassomonas haliotis TaxID=485448 RepID=A0ABY7VFW2_9GAMM|nr:IS5 family transposase [Thalassomonas haliotis]WDE10122.1 IS5 family transposase [Thalassomonas haliotis]WDE10487.1 IS5 family transposase [Thalassomonas haliotis]WDE12584.1 IS5 family transposase [Thalassomonas haliotis]WDE13747.1 IS5 family transposase [Thalassomonas haliotis]WDE13980.1 IS5 family transposase [Thalassomonas haliotis]
MLRTMLTDAIWQKLSQLMRHSGRVYNKPEHRMTFEGILYRMRTGLPWRDLPSDFGHWNTVFRRFNLWSKKGIIDLLFKCLSKNSDVEWLFLDGTIVRAHQHSSGAASKDNQAIGKSRGGNSTKIHLAVDSCGLPVYFELSGGQINDVSHANSLITHSPQSEYVVADKGYDSEAVRKCSENNGAISVIPRRKNSKKGNEEMDWCLYKYRHLVENAFARIKHFRAIATRYDKLEQNYASMVNLAFAMMWLPMWID